MNAVENIELPEFDVKDVEEQQSKEEIEQIRLNSSNIILATDSRQDIPSNNSIEIMTGEESKLLESMGILELLKEEGKEDSSQSTADSSPIRHQTTQPSQQNRMNTSYLSSLSNIWNRMSTNKDSSIADIEESKYNPILLGIGATLFLFPHLAVLLSLPPVLQRRGAPYLPTFGNKLNAMFDIIYNTKSHITIKLYETKDFTKVIKICRLG